MQTNILGALYLSALLVAGCQKGPPTAAANPAAVATSESEAKPQGVRLSADQQRAIDLMSVPVKVAQYSAQTAGYGTVLVHDTIAQAVAELATAQATEKQSGAALQRSQRLSGTAGAISADVEETNLRQAAVDKAALALARQRLSSTVGQDPPWKHDQNAALLQELANGTIKLVRVTFPLGALSDHMPRSLRATRIDAAPVSHGWRMDSIWPAPADANIPGRSLYALLRERDVGEGERLMVWAPVGAAETGVLIPASAIVISEGKYWCYIEKQTGLYVRTEVDASKPLEDGYFVTQGVQAADRVVVKGGGQLLAQESDSGTGGD